LGVLSKMLSNDDMLELKIGPFQLPPYLKPSELIEKFIKSRREGLPPRAIEFLISFR